MCAARIVLTIKGKENKRPKQRCQKATRECLKIEIQICIYCRFLPAQGWAEATCFCAYIIQKRLSTGAWILTMQFGWRTCNCTENRKLGAEKVSAMRVNPLLSLKAGKGGMFQGLAHIYIYISGKLIKRIFFHFKIMLSVLNKLISLPGL